MALIECPECGTDVSSRAQTCPRCAYPLGKGQRGLRRSHGAGIPSPYSGLDVAKAVVARVVLGGVLFASGVTWEAPPVIISSLVIFGSCVPIWFKARRAAILGSGDEAGALESRLKEFMSDMEYRQVQQLDDIADQNARQIAELEERLDFTERLLAKQADPMQQAN